MAPRRTGQQGRGSGKEGRRGVGLSSFVLASRHSKAKRHAMRWLGITGGWRRISYWQRRRGIKGEWIRIGISLFERGQ